MVSFQSAGAYLKAYTVTMWSQLMKSLLVKVVLVEIKHFKLLSVPYRVSDITYLKDVEQKHGRGIVFR